MKIRKTTMSIYLCASSSTAAPSFFLSREHCSYVPCVLYPLSLSHLPKHIQQNSYLHFWQRWKSIEHQLLSTEIKTVSTEIEKSIAHHVIAAAILFNRSIALGVGATSRILHKINGGFVIVILSPFCIQSALDRIVTVVATFETAPMSAFTLAILSIAMQHTVVFYCQCTARCRTPPQPWNELNEYKIFQQVIDKKREYN